MENSFENEENFNFEDYLEHKGPTEDIINYVYNQSKNPEPHTKALQEQLPIDDQNISKPIQENDEQLNNCFKPIIFSDQNPEIKIINDQIFSKLRQENDEQLNKLDNLVKNSEKNQEIKKNENSSTIFVNGRSRKISLRLNNEDSINFDEVKEKDIRKYQNFKDTQENLRNGVIVGERNDVILENYDGYPLDGKTILNLFTRRLKENKEDIEKK